MPPKSEPIMAPSPSCEDLTQRRKEAQRVAESSFSLRFSAILCTAILQYARKLRRFLWMNCLAKRLECVQLAGAVVRHGAVRKREQAPRTPNASRSSLAALPRCVHRVSAV